MFNLRQGQGSLTKKVAPAGVMGNATRLCRLSALWKVETFAGQFVDREPRGEGKFLNRLIIVFFCLFVNVFRFTQIYE